jgi:RNase adaptor protein for sRNA GlmZ degradation
MTDTAAPGDLHVPSQVTLISFGYACGAAPEAGILLDVRPFTPDLGPGFQGLTIRDYKVERAFYGNTDATDFTHNVEPLIRLHLYRGASVVVAVGDTTGTQFAPELVNRLATLLGYDGIDATVYHRDINRTAPPVPALPAP